MNQVAVIILAAGKGSRINAKGNLNKVAYELGHKPMIVHTVSHLEQAKFSNILVVVGFAAASVRHALGNRVNYVIQSKRLGTGHAVKTALKQIPPNVSTIITMYGDDSAFYPVDIFHQLWETHQNNQAKITVVSIKLTDSSGLGRIIRDNQGKITAIVEEKNATKSQKLIKEINTGLFCFDHKFLDKALNHITKNPVSGEYYLTDTVAYAKSHNAVIASLLWPNPSIWHGVNTLEQLDKARELSSLIDSGMT